MTIPKEAAPNGHICFLLLDDPSERPRILTELHARGVNATSHFVPLHASPAGKKYGRTEGSLAVTERAAEQIIRLPMHLSMTPDDQDRVIEAVFEVVTSP